MTRFYYCQGQSSWGAEEAEKGELRSWSAQSSLREGEGLCWSWRDALNAARPAEGRALQAGEQKGKRTAASESGSG